MPIVANDYEIANLALDHLHLTVKIASLDATSPQAQAAKRWYEIVRKALLKMHWEFAERRAVLVEDAATAHAHPHWLYAYEPPANMLKPKGFAIEGYRNVPGDWKIPFEWKNVADGSAKRIYTNLPPGIAAEFVYTLDVTDVAEFPEQFVNCFSHALALYMAKPLRIGAKEMKDVMLGWQSAILDARADEAGDVTHDLPDASWILARS